MLILIVLSDLMHILPYKQDVGGSSPSLPTIQLENHLK